MCVDREMLPEPDQKLASLPRRSLGGWRVNSPPLGLDSQHGSFPPQRAAQIMTSNLIDMLTGY